MLNLKIFTAEHRTGKSKYKYLHICIFKTLGIFLSYPIISLFFVKKHVLTTNQPLQYLI